MIKTKEYLNCSPDGMRSPACGIFRSHPLGEPYYALEGTNLGRFIRKFGSIYSKMKKGIILLLLTPQQSSTFHKLLNKAEE